MGTTGLLPATLAECQPEPGRVAMFLPLHARHRSATNQPRLRLLWAALTGALVHTEEGWSLVIEQIAPVM